MKPLVTRLLIIIGSGILLFGYIFPWSAYNFSIPFTGPEYRFGLDLQGGIELDYKVDLSEASQKDDYNSTKQKEILEGLKSIIDKRIETLNINDSVITTASYGGEQHIIVQIPLKGNDSLENNENIQKAKEAIGKVVKIEFKELRTEILEEDIAERSQLAQLAFNEIQQGKYDFFVTADAYKLSHEKVITGVSDDLEAIFEGPFETNTLNEVTLGDDSGYLIIQPGEENSQLYSYLYISKTPSDWIPAMDSEGRVLNDEYFVNSSVQFNEAFQPMVELVFNNEGGEIFGELTKRLAGQQIAIFVGGELLTAPNVNEQILTGKAVITGNYTAEEANKLSQNINTGVVPAPIYLTSEQTSDSKLGAESLKKLLVAGASGFVLIFIFLVFVYRISGLIATLSLMLYVVILLAVVKTLGIVLTMASIAGLVLSIGMAIDANILIFERIRDEISKGEKLIKASEKGFSQSWSAIWDSNITGFLVAMILFIFGINLIKGFGLMLALGIIVSLFACFWISRILVIYTAGAVKSSKKFIGK